MSCEHKITQVVDSRPYCHDHSRKEKFKYLRFRRQECQICGERFNTFELTEEQIKELKEKESSIIEKIKKALYEN